MLWSYSKYKLPHISFLTKKTSNFMENTFTEEEVLSSVVAENETESTENQIEVEESSSEDEEGSEETEEGTDEVEETTDEVEEATDEATESTDAE